MRTNDTACRYVRVKDICGVNGILPISKSAWWLWVKQGKAPAPVKLSPRITAWRVEDIDAFCERLNKEVQA